MRESGDANQALRRRRSLGFPAHIAVLLTTLALGVASSRVQAQAGPLQITELNPLYSLHYTVRTEVADPVPAGSFAASLGTRYANVFEYEVDEGLDLRMDVERMVNELVLRYGLSGDVEVGGRVALRTDWGGVLDPVIEGFHEVFLLSNGGRASVAQGEVEMRLTAGDTVAVHLPPSTAALEGIRVFAKARLLDRPGGLVSLRMVTQMPAGNSPASAGGIDVGLEMLGRLSLPGWHFHGQVGAVRFSPLDELSDFANPLPLTGALGFERMLGPRVGLLGQVLAGSPYYRGFGEVELDRPAINIAVGTVIRPASDWHLEFSFTEDFPGNNPAVDMAFTLILRHQM